MKGMTGFDAPPVEVFYDETTGLDGGLLRHTRVSTREMFIPVIIWAKSRPDFLALKRDLLGRLNPARGVGRLRFTEGDGTARHVDCVYTGGAEGTYSEDEGGFFWQKYGLTFRAMDPYFYAESPIEVQWSSGAESLVPFFSEPFLGLHLNASRSINGSVPLSAVGDFEAWPTWLITGPIDGVSFAVSGASTGSFTLNVSLGVGDVVYVDTRPSKRRILKLDNPPFLIGDNWWDRLEPGDTFWPLNPAGTNTVTINATNVGPTTAISMSYRPRFYSV
jgi:hypothetical protein